MGSQSSSGMSGRGSSGDPDESEPERSQNPSQRSRRQTDRGTERQADRGGERQTERQGNRGTERQGTAGEEDVDLAQVLAYLLRRGQVRLVHGGGARVQLVQSYSDSDDDSDGAWEGRLGDRYNPPVDAHPDTQDVDSSEIKTQILLATASSGSKGMPSFAQMLQERERGRCRGTSFSHGECSNIRAHFLPNQVTHKEVFHQKAFCGVYSEDGQLFLSACQDQNVRLYDTGAGRFRLVRTVKARDVGWSVLDATFTPDRSALLYSSWSDYIHLCSVDGDSETHTALDLNPDERRFCVFSLTVSSDGREILGGANDGCLYVFDREQNKRTLKIDAHEDDVNAVQFADSSCQIVLSGSDDALCKVWDRRTLREDRPQPVGQLAGHRDGLTFIHSKGDGRYLISNSKDQSIKLWDVRRFSPKEGLAASRLAVTQQNWDYRWQQVPQRALKRHKLAGDTSVMTYRGHGVLHTLIRCRFSPEFSTGQRYIYTGCSTGRVVIYDVLTGCVVSRLSDHDACVRDVSWHPYEDSIVSSSWDGGVRLWEHRQSHLFDEERESERERERERGVKPEEEECGEEGTVE
ncbi:DDB1- and CUL4-associated factor 11 [Amia ocellicauda]|uniref:DDB1- and CUL4-associated factor 11 n=1 Tax=Amia ocellicauda TaxID=2972642 RepID=UPI00346388D5